MHTTKMYCIFLKDLTGKAPVMSVYMVPVVALARAAKQNISWNEQASWAGKNTINLGAGKNNVSVLVACWCSIRAPTPHMAFVGGCGFGQVGAN